MDRTALLVAVLVALAVVPAGGSAGNDGAPLADAGLDQPAEVGETVLLDATGSRDPDGRIETYEWRIETPGGRTVTPVDPTAPRTRFVVNESGRYEVTVTVTDNNGEQAADTLYVDVDRDGGPTLVPTFGADTLVIEGSDLTYKDDVAYTHYHDNEKLPGRKIGDGEHPVNEVMEGSVGITVGVVQLIVGTKEMTFSYQVSGETAREMEKMANYNTGKHEDEISEKLNTRSNGPAVLEDYVLNDAKVVDGVSDRADIVKVIIRVTKNKGAVDYGLEALGRGMDIAAYANDTGTSKLSNGIVNGMNAGE